MALVALIATAAFVVVAHRRQRQLGLLAAIGASDRHLRLVMVANGFIVGAAAALVGGALGVVGWILAAPAVETAVGHRLDRWALPWTLIIGCMTLAVLAATAAAWWPARMTARLPVMAALSRRPARPTPVHRSIALGLGLTAAGAVGIVVAFPGREHVRPQPLIGGLIALVVGVVLGAPAAIRLVAAPAARLPFAARLALRDLARYQARAAAALAAITLGLGISVTIVVLAQANEYRADEGNLSARDLLIQVGDPRTAPDPNLTAAERHTLDTYAATIAAAVGPATLIPLDVAINGSVANDVSQREPVGLARPINHGFRGLGFPYVATPELLARLGIAPATIGASTELLTTAPGNVMLLDFTKRPDVRRPQSASPTVQHIALPAYTSAPTSLITARAMRDNGWVTARAGWFVSSPTALTSAQITAARQAAARTNLTVEVRSSQDDLATLRTGATGVGALLALAIVAMTIGLLRGESAADVRTLTATGAAPRTRRALTANTAGTLALLGVVLAVAGSYAALAAAYHADLGRLAGPPFAHLALLAIGLPLTAALGGWMLAGREPAAVARQLQD
jgi:putative ABC transport system permease protein